MADGSINIDLLLNDQTDKTWSEFKSKAETAGKVGYEKFKDSFKGDPLVAKLETKANKAGIKNFRELLNQLPKEKQTELLTKAEKGEVINYEKLLREIPSKITSQVELNDNASSGLRSLKNQAEEVGDKFHRLKDIAIGTFVGSTISAGVRTVVGFISGLGQEALNSSDALQKFKSTMQLGGFGEEEIDKATKQVKKYADDTVYDLNTVSNTTAQLAANGVKDYIGLTEAAGNLNAQAGGNADTFKSVAMVLTQTAGAGKLTTENWNQMADAIPGASGVLQKALKENGAFTGNFRDAMADGQITADEFNDALTKLGSNDAAKKAATSTNTFEGAWGSLEANVVSGLDNMINKIGKKNLTGIINQLADVSTSAFGTMGKAIANVFGYINNHKKDITGILNSLKEISGALIGGAWDVAKDTITGIASAFGLISKDSKKAHNPLKTLNNVLGKIAEHKSLIEALGAAIATAFAIKKVSDFVGATRAVITNLKLATLAQKAFNLATKANIFVIIVTAIVALGVAFYELYKHNKKFKKFVDDCVDAAAGFFKGIGKWFGQATKAVGKFFSGLGKWFGNIGKSIGSGSNAIGKWFDGLVKGFVKGWNKFVNTAVKLAKGFGKLLLYALAVPVGLVIVITKPLVEPLKKIFSSLIKWIEKAWNGTIKFLSKIWEPVAKTWNKAWKLIQKAFEFVWKILSKFIKNEFNFWKKLFTVTLNFITKIWNTAWNAISKTFESIWNRIKKFFKPIIEWLSDVISDTLKAIKKVWDKAWDSISDFFSDTWNGMKKFGSKAINSLKDTFDDVLGKIGKSFGDTWTGVKNGFSDMWDGMKKLAGDGINAVIKIPNAGIDGINGLIHDFGGPKNALGKIPKVKFANGTGAINQLTHAILNDGNDSPETGNKETLIHPNGKMEIVQGRNTERLLLPGTEVLNASETAMMMGMSGTKHFAGGTGFWSKLISGAGSTISNVAGSIWGGLKNGVEKFTKMFSYITGAVADPAGTLGKVLNLKSGGVSSVMDGVAGGAYKKVTSTAKDWWSTLWSMASESSSSGTGSKGDDYAFKSKSKDSGVDPWGYFYRECVSFVASRLKNMGVSADLFSHLGNGADWVNAPVPHSNKPKVGDVAVYGAGSEFGNHAAMVTGVQGDKISGEEYNWSGDGQYHTYNGRKASGATTFLDFGRSAGAKAKEVATNNPLSKLIKKQTGGMMSWIQKFIAPINDSSTGADNDVQSWSGDVKKALSKLGLSTSSSMVSKILEQIQTESGGNAKAMGGNDGLADGNATGLMQVKPGTFKAYAVDGHNNIMNGYDNILAGLNYAKHRYGSDLSFLGQGHGYANGGRTNGIGVVGEVQGEDEWVTNPNRSTADTNIIGSIKETAQKQPNSFAAKLAGVISGAKSGMQAITNQQPIIAGSSTMQSANGGIDLSGDVHMTVKLDSGEIARITYPKLKVLQNQEIQMKGQVTGNTYVY
ncbi:tape measure protein [Leuconostoc falkenbergense]|uniref:tape measure protein n=1 Tax=Leuconostoc falkenbergense TaxID=2766470 RepID=UPI0021A9F453|nr:tape measure protein [Leuconostoc falkenbergense]